jgi:PAS domain S-box-containing protein
MEKRLEQEKNLDILNQAFQAFSDTTTKFQEAYQKLEDKVAYLSQELAKKNEELKVNLSELEQTRKYINNILESISDGVVAINLEGTITRINKAAQHITGFTAREVLLKKYTDIFMSVQQNSDFVERITQETRGTGGREMRIKNKAGEEIPIVAYSSCITDEVSEVIGVVITFNDLTKIKQLENEVERSKRLAALGEMAAGVAHEIRNPLGGIEMFASVLDREYKDVPDKRKITQNIILGVKNINRIISELLNFTKTFRKTNFQTIDLVDCLESALSFSMQEVEKRKIQLERSYTHADSFHIFADKDQLQQVFLNIFLNATEAISHDHGVIAIRYVVHPQESCVVIEIADNGGGIKKADIDKVFNPFFTTKTKGTGLGLAISYRIIEAHKGRIVVKSKEGFGTVFSIILPIAYER